MNYLPVCVGNDLAVDLGEDSTCQQIADRLHHVRRQRIERRTLRRVQGGILIAWDFLNFDWW